MSEPPFIHPHLARRLKRFLDRARAPRHDEALRRLAGRLLDCPDRLAPADARMALRALSEPISAEERKHLLALAREQGGQR